MKVNKKSIIVGVLSLLLIMSGFVWYNQDLKFRIADIRLCENDISFFHQYRKLQNGCYKNSYSYGRYYRIMFGEIGDDIVDGIIDNKQNGLKFSNQFEYVLNKYRIKVFVKNKIGDGSILINESYGDLIYVKVYNDNGSVIANYRIVIALSNPGKYTVSHEPIYKKATNKDIKEIINLILERK